MRKIKVTILLSILLFGSAVAQQDGLKLGSFNLYPTLGLSSGYQDNFLFQDESDKKGSQYVAISPGVRLESLGEKTNFLAQYDITKTYFDFDSKFNTEMQHLLGSVDHRVSNRSNFGVSAEYYDGTDRIGTGNQQGGIIDLDLDPDEWHSLNFEGKWHYGGVGAKGAVDLLVGTIDREYDNNREFTATRDRETQYFGATYSHQVTPKTSYLAQFKRSNIDYDIATLDSTETRVMLGAEWEATGKTSARALVGYLTKDFDEPQHDDFSGLAVEVGASWRPRTYSVFDLTLARETDETNGNGSYIVRNSAALGWTHFWKDRFSTNANIGKSDENYKDSLRDDSLNYYGVSASYQFTDWFMSGLGYKHVKRSSSIEDFSYKDDSVLFTIELSK